MSGQRVFIQAPAGDVIWCGAYPYKRDREQYKGVTIFVTTSQCSTADGPQRPYFASYQALSAQIRSAIHNCPAASTHKEAGLQDHCWIVRQTRVVLPTRPSISEETQYRRPFEQNM